MSTEQMGFAKRIRKKDKFALFDGQNKTFCPFQIHWLTTWIDLRTHATNLLC